MRGIAAIGCLALFVVGACGGESLPRTVDAKWITRCETLQYAGKCGWALVASLERDEPARPSEVPPVLHGMCDRHKIAAACKRLALVEEPARVVKGKSAPDDDGGAPAPADEALQTA